MIKHTELTGALSDDFLKMLKQPEYSFPGSVYMGFGTFTLFSQNPDAEICENNYLKFGQKTIYSDPYLEEGIAVFLDSKGKAGTVTNLPWMAL